MFRHGHLETPPAGHDTRRPGECLRHVLLDVGQRAERALRGHRHGSAGGGRGSRRVGFDHRAAPTANARGKRAASRTGWPSPTSSGRGDGSMRYTAAGNPVVSERRGAVVVNGLRVEIGQAAAACAFSLDRSQQSVPATGGRIDVSVSAQAGCAWTARSDAPWISITSGAAGQGPGSVSLSVAANPDRAGAIERRHHCRAALPHRAGGSGHRRPRPDHLPAPRRAGVRADRVAADGVRRCGGRRHRGACQRVRARRARGRPSRACPGS